MVARGEIRYYTFKSPDKRRPVLVLTRESAIAYLDDVTVAPLTTSVRAVPSQVFLGKEDGMPKECAANLYYLQTIPKHKLGSILTTLSAAKMREVDKAIQFALQLELP